MSNLALKLKCEPIRYATYDTIDTAYIPMGSGFNNASRIIVLQNLTNALLMFSFDGIEDHLLLPSQGQLVLDITANKSITSGFYLPEGQKIYVRKVETPTSGSAVLSVFYGATE